jgi:glucose/arabinose dehydrogenase
MTRTPSLSRPKPGDVRHRPRVEQLESRDVPANPVVFDPGLTVTAVVPPATVAQPTGLAFLGPDDALVTEKGTGKVQRLTNGTVSTVLDLAVNRASERGLLGIALHPNFAANGYVYLYWTESSTGADSAVTAEVPLLGNRVDRFVWNGSTLTQDRNIIRLRARQADANQPERGNHDGGKVKFGPDGKLYVMIGDNGRRGQMQNLPDGPFGQGLPDDQFPDGGPEPDDAHLTGVVLRLNDDGTTPTDNPFYKAGAEWGGSAGANLQKVFAYGLRNGFGLAFDPIRGDLWDAQNGDDSFSEINRIEPGANLGWVQVMGPLSRIAQFREIENTAPFVGLQQVRWPASNIATTPEEALARMFQVVQNAKKFDATLVGSEEVPNPVTTSASADLELKVLDNGTLRYKFKATGPINDATMAHLHLGGDGQAGPFVVFLAEFATPKDFKKGDTIAEGVITDADLIPRPGFPAAEATVAELVARMKQGRIYANLHTVANPAGEIRGQVIPRGQQVSKYSDPEFSWKYEVSPVGIGFQVGDGLGEQYAGDLFAGQAVPEPLGGRLFRFDLSDNRKALAPTDPLLADRVADNTAKFNLTESGSLVFGERFGIAVDIQTGPDGNLYVVSLSDGTIYRIHPVAASGGVASPFTAEPGSAANGTSSTVTDGFERDIRDPVGPGVEAAVVVTGEPPASEPSAPASFLGGGFDLMTMNDLMTLDPIEVG